MMSRRTSVDWGVERGADVTVALVLLHPGSAREMQVQRHALQQVVEVVRHPTGDLTDRFHFLRLTEALFGEFAPAHFALEPGGDVLPACGGCAFHPRPAQQRRDQTEQRGGGDESHQRIAPQRAAPAREDARRLDAEADVERPVAETRVGVHALDVVDLRDRGVDAARRGCDGAHVRTGRVQPLRRVARRIAREQFAVAAHHRHDVTVIGRKLPPEFREVAERGFDAHHAVETPGGVVQRRAHREVTFTARRDVGAAEISTQFAATVGDEVVGMRDWRVELQRFAAHAHPPFRVDERDGSDVTQPARGLVHGVLQILVLDQRIPRPATDPLREIAEHQFMGLEYFERMLAYHPCRAFGGPRGFLGDLRALAQRHITEQEHGREHRDREQYERNVARAAGTGTGDSHVSSRWGEAATLCPA